LILFGGPTGSGKTTVLHAALRHCATPERSLMTVEPAVTHFLPGAVQVQTNPRGGITFAAALRGIMHADPDLVMVADAPDGETATLAVEAALTGHLVMLQLHANDAASAIRRLLDLGVEPFLLASSLVASLNQRLVRRVCTECRAALLPAEDTRREWRERAERGGLHWPEGEPEFVRGEGCEHCRGTGYHGRTAIFELLTVDEEMARLIAQDAGAPELRAAAVRAGMTTLFADGLRRALDGITSPVEVARVTSWMVSGE
jgi:type II secretory ATPase GspE/PulE/Tfp pilus assembly ATPase PilB-like protein